MSLIKCPECNREVSSHAPSCPHCGVRIENNVKRCPICGGFVLMGDTQCPHCHAKFISSTTTSSPNIPFEKTSIPKAGKEDSFEVQETPRNTGRQHHWGLLALLICVILLAIGGYYWYSQRRAQVEKELYMQLKDCRDPQNFDDFIAEYPSSEHIDTVKFMLTTLKTEISTWQKAEISLDKKQLQQFMNSYPSSPYVLRAKQMIDSLDWKVAERAANIKAYETYMANHEDGAYYDIAMQQRDSLRKVNDSIAKAKRDSIEATKKKAAAKKTTSRKTATSKRRR